MQKQLTVLVIFLLTALSAPLSAAPVGYTVNSDSGTENSDGLYRIDLATGEEIERIGTVQSALLQTRIDVEGLALSPDRLLYGVDDESLKLFRIDTGNALVDKNMDYDLKDLTKGKNDFGMTFACDGSLYLTSVIRKTLYQVTIDDPTSAKPTVIGSEGSLGANISAIAAYGTPTRLYGLGNGTAGENGSTAAKLYEIDLFTGVAKEIGPLGPAVAPYSEGGLSFDSAGQLWAITDRRPLLQPSQVMRINTSTGVASDVRNTGEEGYESLAIDVPQGCFEPNDGDIAEFFVQKRFNDSNDEDAVELKIKCTSGFPLENSITVTPNAGDFGSYEVRFVVRNFNDGALNCEVWEETPVGYQADYDCQSGSSCSTGEGTGPCTFEAVSNGQQNLCLIQNYVEPVNLVVTKQWEYDPADTVVDDSAVVELNCLNVFDGDGDAMPDNIMHWAWLLDGNPASQTAKVYPDFSGKTFCWTTEAPVSSAVESENSCETPFPVKVGDTELNCTVTNTVFFEGIPSLNQYGLVLFTALMLLTGMVAVRRLV